MLFDKPKIQKWLGVHDPACPVCGRKHQWTPWSDFVTLAIGQASGWRNLGMETTPLASVPLSCDKCGYTMFVSPSAMGITP
jgi:hypothetical protein